MRKNDKMTAPERAILIGIPILFLVGTLFHFIYDLTGNLRLIGYIAPINESVFEHLKLAVFPFIAFYVLYYLFAPKQRKPDVHRWFFSGMLALLSVTVIVPLLFYFFTGAFGIESLVFDIVIFLIGIVIAQLLALHTYRHTRPFNAIFSLILMFGLLILFAYLTYHPLDLPIFINPSA